MGLQVRLVHALADRVMELEPRAGGGPLVVGRAAEADIQIPSLNVSRRHAMLHPRDGGWILQDAGGGRGTFVNGQPITGAVKLKSGDVVTFGTDPTPATLVIDPYGAAGHPRPPAAETPETTPSSRRRAAPAGSALPQPTAAAPSPRPVAPPAALPIDSGDPFAAEPGEAEAGDSIEAGAEWIAAAPAASAAASPVGKRRRKDQMSGGLKAATAVLTLLIIGGAVWLAVKRSRDADKAVAQAPATKPAPVLRKVAPPVATDPGEPTPGTTGNDSKQVASAGSSGSAPASPSLSGPSYKASIDLPPGLEKGPGGGQAPANSSAKAEMDAELNPDAVKPSAAAADKYWAGVEEAHNISEPVTAVVIYEDYLKLFPDGKHVSEVKQFMEDALDQLWWQRIADLMKKEQDIQKDISKKDTEIAAETSAEFKEKLVGEKADLTKEYEKAASELKEMKYELQDPPNVHDPAAIKLLRQARDAHVYDVWKQAIHLRIKTSRGAKVF